MCGSIVDGRCACAVMLVSIIMHPFMCTRSVWGLERSARAMALDRVHCKETHGVCRGLSGATQGWQDFRSHHARSHLGLPGPEQGAVNHRLFCLDGCSAGRLLAASGLGSFSVALGLFLAFKVPGCNLLFKAGSRRSVRMSMYFHRAGAAHA